MVAPVQPQLYLYSSADALIPPSEVHLFMQQQVRPASLAAVTPFVTAMCPLIVSLHWSACSMCVLSRLSLAIWQL